MEGRPPRRPLLCRNKPRRPVYKETIMRIADGFVLLHL